MFGKKVVDFSKQDDKYTISYKYMWSNFNEVSFCTNVYGKYNDSIQGINSLGQSPNYECEEGDFFENNFESYSDKLETYHYVFEKVNGKINLVNFYID